MARFKCSTWPPESLCLTSLASQQAIVLIMHFQALYVKAIIYNKIIEMQFYLYCGLVDIHPYSLSSTLGIPKSPSGNNQSTACTHTHTHTYSNKLTTTHTVTTTHVYTHTCTRTHTHTHTHSHKLTPRHTHMIPHSHQDDIIRGHVLGMFGMQT